MELIFASHNQNKVNEAKLILGNGIKLFSLDEIRFSTEIPETGDTIEENAKQKAHNLHERLHKNCVADDTGLEVEVLNGEPGVRSARYAGEEKDNLKNIQKLLAALRGKTNRSARFKTVLCLIVNDIEYTFTGIITGEIASEMRGANGFGYDSIFIPNGFTKTFAEMEKEEKNSLSHRFIALAKMTEFLLTKES